MNKKNILPILFGIIFPIVFNVLFFLLGDKDKTAAEWVAYAMIHISYIIAIFAPYISKSNPDLAFLGLPLNMISLIYFAAVLLSGIIIFIVNPEKVILTVIIEVVLLGIFAALFITSLNANEKTSQNTAVHNAEVSYIKEISAKIQSLSEISDDYRVNKMIERLYDIAHSSPSKTNAQCAAIENDIIENVNSLEMLLYQNDTEAAGKTAGRIANLLNERNRVLRIMN